jgi:tetratricopeptide (TPR) repeat protein
MLRLIMNKAKHHYNLAVEHAERNRIYQAITELQNSLDLNKNNINAHLLLGTIYARQKRYDQAIQEWQAVLENNPVSQKAYRYIEKAQKVQSALPVLKWIQGLLAALLGCLLVIFILFILVLRPDPAEELLKKAIIDYKQNHYGPALEKVDAFSKRYDSSSLHPVALLLADSIRKNIEENRQKILNHMDAGNYTTVLETCKLLEAQNPDPGTIQFLKHIKENVRSSMKKTIEKHISDQEKEDAGDLSLLQENLKRFGQYFPKDENLETYQSQLTALLRRDAQKEQRLLQKELDNISAIEDPAQALAGLIKFNRQYPQFAKEAFVSRKIRELKQTIMYGHLNHIQEQLQKGDLDAAGAGLAQLKSQDLKEFPLLAQEYHNLSSLYSKRKNEQNRRNTEEYLTALEKALEEENIGMIQSLLPQKSSFSLTAEEERRFENIGRLSRIRTALLTYNQIINRDPLRGMDSLTEKEARETLSSLPMLLEDLPPDLSLKVRDQLLFHACASHMKLGETEKAREIFQNLLREYPYSPYLPLAARMVSD